MAGLPAVSKILAKLYSTYLISQENETEFKTTKSPHVLYHPISYKKILMVCVSCENCSNKRGRVTLGKSTYNSPPLNQAENDKDGNHP